jgi:hypothetical protein
MSFPKGVWCVNAVLINQKTVMNNEGFRFLNVTDEEFSIEPVGIKFRVRQKTEDRAVLESNHELFYADFSYSQELFRIELTRPDCQESILFEAELVASAELAEIV